jgi:hypothetical protein
LLWRSWEPLAYFNARKLLLLTHFYNCRCDDSEPLANQQGQKLINGRAIVTFPAVQDLANRINDGFDEADETVMTVVRNTRNWLLQWKIEVGPGNWIEAYEASGFKRVSTPRKTGCGWR